MRTIRKKLWVVRAIVLATVLGGEHLCAQELRARVSVKVVLDADGNRPQMEHGWFYDDSKIVAAVLTGNEILENSGAEWRLELDEIVEVDTSEWYGPVDLVRARGRIEAAALADPRRYRWRPDAINVYVVNDGLGSTGVCTFPARGHIVVMANVWIPEPQFAVFPAEQLSHARGAELLHEIGHYFNLCHTHGCCCNVVCLGTPDDPAQQQPVGDDGVADTLPDLDCWGAIEMARWSFQLDYEDLDAADRLQVDQSFLNLMSYHWVDRIDQGKHMLTPDQLTRAAAEMHPITGHRTHVLNLPRPAFSNAPEIAETHQEISFDAAPSTAEDGHEIVSYAWDFGDGSEPVGPSALATAKHTYTPPGRYSVRLTVTDDRGLWNVSDQKVTVRLGGEVSEPWSAQDVGDVIGPGGSRFEDGCLRVQGAKGNISGHADKFRYIFQLRNGDFSLVARVTDWQSASTSAKAGIMVRESLESDARHASVVIHRRTSTFRHDFAYRNATAARSRSEIHENYESLVLWLQVERRGDTILGSVSPDGVIWSEADAVELSGLADTVHVGVAAAGQPTEGPWNVATFCNLSLLSAPETPIFLRGDCDGDGNACSGVNDALELLSWLFLGRAKPPCLAACDPDGNGELELADAVYGLNFCFKGTNPPVAPFPECGTGIEADTALGCDASGCEPMESATGK